MVKRQGREKPGKIEQSPRTGVRTSGRTNGTPGYHDLRRAGPGEEKKHIKRGAKGLGVSLPLSRSLALSLSRSLTRSRSLLLSLSLRLLGQHALMPRGCIFLYFLNKTEL